MSSELIWYLIGTGAWGIMFGGWAYNDCAAKQISMSRNRPWKSSDPSGAFFSFFLGILILGPLFGLLAAYLSYNGLRAYSQAGPQTSPRMRNADDLLKWKQLLDAGAISQEEFDAKKAQLIGIQPSTTIQAVQPKKATW